VAYLLGLISPPSRPSPSEHQSMAGVYGRGIWPGYMAGVYGRGICGRGIYGRGIWPGYMAGVYGRGIWLPLQRIEFFENIKKE
jgi:hypothetical protein